MTTTTNSTTTTAPAIRRAYLTGDTYMVREQLAAGGWRWDAQRKAYWRDAAWTDDADVIDRVRLLPGVRNRGTFRATIEAI